MITPVRRYHILPAAIGACLLAAPVLAMAADGGELPFSEAEIFLELNDTDGDLGIHASIDGGPWKTLVIEDPGGRAVLNIMSSGRLLRQGLTQLFLESAEPPFEDLPPGVFFRRFPEGVYEIEARTLSGAEMEGMATLSHVLAARPAGILVSGVPAGGGCDVDPLPLVSTPVIIQWDPVTTSHPTIGKAGTIEIARYQLFVERPGVKFSLDLPPDVTEVEVPAEVFALGDEFKFEIIARTTAGNNTAVESCFQLD